MTHYTAPMSDVPNWVAQYIGLPYQDKGFNCYGVARAVWRDRAGLLLPDYEGKYDSAKDGARVEVLIKEGIHDAGWFEVPRGEERELDGVLCRGVYKAGGRWRHADMHVGVVVAPGIMLHSEVEHDAVLCRYYEDRRMEHRILGFYRHELLNRA